MPLDSLVTMMHAILFLRLERPFASEVAHADTQREPHVNVAHAENAMHSIRRNVKKQWARTKILRSPLSDVGVYRETSHAETGNASQHLIAGQRFTYVGFGSLRTGEEVFYVSTTLSSTKERHHGPFPLSGPLLQGDHS
jgi:hypothetical protein